MISGTVNFPVIAGTDECGARVSNSSNLLIGIINIFYPARTKGTEPIFCAQPLTVGCASARLWDYGQPHTQEFLDQLLNRVDLVSG